MVRSFFEFFCHSQQKGPECGFTSAVILSFFRRSSTFSTIRAVKKPNLRSDLNPENNSLPTCTELLTLQIGCLF
jgi:glutaredoxin-related protein